MNRALRLAEYVLPGHPDKLCDRIADGVVDLACAHDPDAAVAVEVAVSRDVVFVDGRIAAGTVPMAEAQITAEVRAAYAEAGYGGVWTPQPDSLRVVTDLSLEALSDEERALRGVADDQAICIGFATGDERTRFLPLEHHLAWRLARCLSGLRDERPDLGLGPDGKLLVCLQEEGERSCFHTLSVSLQHDEQVDWVELTRAVRGAVLGELESAARELPELEVDERTLRVVLNGAGPFAVGGPYGDNGLSGKKLVVDAGGPRAPIGGGAMSGKDPHKVDRLGTLRARQIARDVVATGLAREARVTLAFLPGEHEASFLEILADGRALDARATARWRSRYDLSIPGTYRDLDLGQVRFAPMASWGHFTGASLPRDCTRSAAEQLCAGVITKPG
jgi:S-adenosylmethionine synthetase